MKKTKQSEIFQGKKIRSEGYHSVTQISGEDESLVNKAIQGANLVKKWK